MSALDGSLSAVLPDGGILVFKKKILFAGSEEDRMLGLDDIPEEAEYDI